MRTVSSIILAYSLTAATFGQDAPDRPNILYLMSDDLRNEMASAYGQEHLITPFFDELASKALTFHSAVTNFAYCAPSRNSFLSGRRPDRTGVLNFLQSFRTANPDGEQWVAMPQLFKNAEYFTTAAGKIYHDAPLDQDPKSWSYPANHTAWIKCGEGDMKDPIGSNYCGLTEKSETPYTDEDLVLAECVKRLDLAHASGKSWFVGCGNHRPHAEFRVPKGFYGTELYPSNSSGGDPVTVPKYPGAPKDFPWMSGQWQDGDQQDPHLGCPTCVMPLDHQREIRRWRKAAVTWTDHMLGKMYKHMQQLSPEVAAKTIVVMHSDHGYSLGEQNAWSKKSNYHMAVRVPLLVYVPWMPKSHGKSTEIKAELVDMYRTLADLTGIGPVEDSVQGTSLKSVFEDPESPSPEVARKAGFSQIPRCKCQYYPEHKVKECDAGACLWTPKNSTEFNYMGYSMQADRPELGGHWRYTAWLAWNHTSMTADWNRLEAQELYDLRKLDPMDPDFYDFDGFAANVASDPSNAKVVSMMHQELEEAAKTWH